MSNIFDDPETRAEIAQKAAELAATDDTAQLDDTAQAYAEIIEFARTAFVDFAHAAVENNLPADSIEYEYQVKTSMGYYERRKAYYTGWYVYRDFAIRSNRLPAYYFIDQQGRLQEYGVRGSEDSNATIGGLLYQLHIGNSVNPDPTRAKKVIKELLIDALAGKPRTI
jgi:hypothetical protein